MTNNNIDFSTDYLITDTSHKNTIAPWDSGNCGTETPREQSLWRTVIIQAAYDAACAPVTAKARREKTKAIMWFALHNQDFRTVCELANLEPLEILRGVKNYIKRSTVVYTRKSYMKRIRKRRGGRVARNYYRQTKKRDRLRVTLTLTP